jgi:membrane fusion protein (multidrug efflux system)
MKLVNKISRMKAFGWPGIELGWTHGGKDEVIAAHTHEGFNNQGCLQPFRPTSFPEFIQPGPSRNSHVLRRSPTRSLFVVAVTLSLCGCSHEPPPQRLTEVTIGTPIRQDVPVYSQWIGTTVGFIDAEIHSKVTGYLLAQDYKEGSLVNTGDLLFEVDPRPFQAVVDQANAQLNVANAGLTQAKADVDAAKAEIDRAEAAQLKTELDVKRYAPLVKDGTVSQQEFDDATQSNLANLASVASAKGKYDRSVAAVTAAEAQIGVARSSLQAAELNLEFTRVKSPVNGIAGIHTANIGDLVGTDQRTLLTTVSQIDPILVQFPISEQEYLKLRDFFLAKGGSLQSSLELILSDGSVYPIKGKIDIVGRGVESSTGTMRIRAMFSNPGNVLRPGEYSRIRAATSVRKDALLVPQRAVQELQGEYELALVGPDNKVAFRTVKAGDRVGSYWVIEQGLNPTDRVVVEGLQDIKTGQTVDPKPAKMPPLGANPRGNLGRTS